MAFSSRSVAIDFLCEAMHWRAGIEFNGVFGSVRSFVLAGEDRYAAPYRRRVACLFLLSFSKSTFLALFSRYDASSQARSCPGFTYSRLRTVVFFFFSYLCTVRFVWLCLPPSLKAADRYVGGPVAFVCRLCISWLLISLRINPDSAGASRSIDLLRPGWGAKLHLMFPGATGRLFDFSVPGFLRSP